MYVSFIGLRLTKTSLTLINRTRFRTKGQSTVTLKPKLESLPILSSVEHLSELYPCSPTRSKDNPLHCCSKFTLVPVFYPSAKIHSCVLLSSLMDPKSPSHPDTRTTHVSSIQDYICDSWCLSVH